jgi:hypothetical protein
MKLALPPIDRVASASRSHKDLFWESQEFKTLVLDQSPEWRQFVWGFVQNRTAWLRLYERLAPEAGALREQIETLSFRPERGIEDEKGRILQKTSETFLYPRFDIGYGVDGYGVENGGRGPHIDYPQRIISLLWYFSDGRSMDGGELDLFHSLNNAPTKVCERITIAENMAVAVLQDEKGWHAVNPVVRTPEPRITVYMTLSSSRPLWRDRKGIHS